MHDRLALTALAEPRHFWFDGFRRFVAPVVAARVVRMPVGSSLLVVATRPAPGPRATYRRS